VSPAAPRALASTAAVARHYLRLLANVRTATGFIVTAGIVLLGGMQSIGFEAFPAVLWLMMLAPLLHWGIAGVALPLDQAMPVDRARHDLVRMACGAAWAAAALATAIVPVSLLLYFARDGRPGAGFWWYPPLLVIGGVVCYVIGAAAWLRRGSFVVFYCVVFAIAALSAVIPDRERVERLLSLRAAPAPGEPLRWMGIAILLLAAAAGIAWLSAIVPREPSRIAAALAPRLRAARGVLRRRPARPGAADAPRRPAPFRAAFWREVVLLRPLVSAAVVILMTAWLASVGTEGRKDALWTIVYVLPVFWPLVVWRVGTSPRLPRVEPLPMGDVARQLARLAAGAAVLLFTLLPVLALDAVGAGRTASLPAGTWAGYLGAALLLYLLASLPAIAAGEHRGGWTTGWTAFLLLVGLPLVRAMVPPGPLSLHSALVTAFLKPGPPAPAVALWTAILATLAVGAAAAGVNAERTSYVPPYLDPAQRAGPASSVGQA
jgi:hypothetical protein